jgi:hypothetical protein
MNLLFFLFFVLFTEFAWPGLRIGSPFQHRVVKDDWWRFIVRKGIRPLKTLEWRSWWSWKGFLHVTKWWWHGAGVLRSHVIFVLSVPGCYCESFAKSIRINSHRLMLRTKLDNKSEMFVRLIPEGIKSWGQLIDTRLSVCANVWYAWQQQHVCALFYWGAVITFFVASGVLWLDAVCASSLVQPFVCQSWLATAAFNEL